MATQTPKGERIASSSIFKRFLTTAEEYIKQPLRIKKLLGDAYEKASQKNDLGTIAQEAWGTVQLLIRMVRAAAAGEYTGLPTTTAVAAVAVLIYFLSPIDVIPDFIPVIGLLDDMALVAWFSTTLKEELDKFAEWETTRPVVVDDKDDKKEAKMPAAASPAQPESPRQARPAPATTDGQPAPESAKKAGTTDRADDAPAAAQSVPASTTDSTREPNLGNPATGGNVR